MRHIYLLCAFEFLIAQVNTEVFRREADSTGVYANIGAAFDGEVGNTNDWQFSINVDVLYQMTSSELLLINQSKYSESNEARVSNNAFSHLRWIYDSTTLLKYEAFYQIEFDEFLDLEERQLLGLGLRSYVIRKGYGFLAIGSGVMYEVELYESPVNSDKRLWRSTNYVSHRFKLSETVDIDGTYYAQPSISTFSDFRILINQRVNIKVDEAVSVILDLKDRYDNEPGMGIKSNQLEFMVGVQVTI